MSPERFVKGESERTKVRLFAFATFLAAIPVRMTLFQNP
jgi:hypothetical protein